MRRDPNGIAMTFSDQLRSACWCGFKVATGLTEGHIATIGREVNSSTSTLKEKWLMRGRYGATRGVP